HTPMRLWVDHTTRPWVDHITRLRVDHITRPWVDHHGRRLTRGPTTVKCRATQGCTSDLAELKQRREVQLNIELLNVAYVKVM
ncbi:MAG: hypothetical protein ACUVXG_12450, partial [Anaerolineae bacterium]